MDTPIEGEEGQTEVYPSDIWGSGNEVFVVGYVYNGDEADYIIRFNGVSWTRMTGMPTGPFYSNVWGTAATDLYVSGAFVIGGHDADPFETEGFIIHYDGNRWTTVVRDQSVRLGPMWGSSPNNVYAAGLAVDATGTIVTGAALWHFDGTRWSPTESPTNAPLRSIWGTAADDVFLLASDATIWRFNGVRWSLSHTSGIPMSDIWVSPSGDVFVVGEDGTILHGTR